MPGLLRGVARTAVVAGTATAVSGRVQRRQAERFADRDAQIVAERQAAYQQQAPPPQYAEAPPPQSGGGDVVQQLKDLAELKNQGVLTEEEFAAQKAKILG
ncbi:MAG: SHOCT domain-containing protein [Nocardioidaceae bacterium]